MNIFSIAMNYITIQIFRAIHRHQLTWMGPLRHFPDEIP